MAEALRRDAWERTSAWMALLANCHRDPKKTPAFKATDFDPFAAQHDPIPVDMETLKEMFEGKR